MDAGADAELWQQDLRALRVVSESRACTMGSSGNASEVTAPGLSHYDSPGSVTLYDSDPRKKIMEDLARRRAYLWSLPPDSDEEDDVMASAPAEVLECGGEPEPSCPPAAHVHLECVCTTCEVRLCHCLHGSRW